MRCVDRVVSMMLWTWWVLQRQNTPQPSVYHLQKRWYITHQCLHSSHEAPASDTRQESTLDCLSYWLCALHLVRLSVLLWLWLMPLSRWMDVWGCCFRAPVRETQLVRSGGNHSIPSRHSYHSCQLGLSTTDNSTRHTSKSKDCTRRSE